MELVVNKIKELAKSSQEFVDGFLHRCDKSARRNPIEILKRLQRESFSDLMKLRDRQDKFERMLSFYKTSKASPFQESSTHVRGEVDALGAILLLGNDDQQHYDALDRAGIKTGIRSRFTFETTIRVKDMLLAELVASTRDGDEVSGSALSLAKVSYVANVSDWFSAIAIPIGAQSRDIEITKNSSDQRKGLTDLSSFGPPLLYQHNGSTIGLTVRKSNVIASMAQSVSGLGLQPFSDGISQCFSTFGQIAFQFPRGIKFSLLGLHQVPKSSSHHTKLGSLIIPLAKHRRAPEAPFEASAPLMETDILQMVSTGSIAMKLETELDENTKIGGWIEMKNSNPKQLQWAVNMFDDSENESGWGMCVSGITEGSGNRAHLQAESYLKLNFGTKFSLKPGITYAVDGDARIFALMLRSNWSF
ncbi:hypothetical protein JCGZ_08181 [Jatropha curcas]|uniref:JHL20J20.7 protein n=1 Tax=Jatropha curcas TaxID=180498 RepID=E6NTZ0_JATCU|nr:hypothetical protein JCGZ_08181 [Jatropha curcas]BAJ53100.1 JHL20J20.7 [Jatropha curcas]